MCLSQCGCAFTLVFLLRPCTRSVQCIDACVPHCSSCIIAVLSERVRRGIPKPNWACSQKCPMFYLLSGLGFEGGAAERPLFWSFVYVRSGSVVLGEQRSLGMLGLYSLGIKCSSVVCTVYSRYNYTVGHIWLETDL